MASASTDFDAPDLAARVEQLSQFDLDQLPFGVILLDRQDTVLFFNETEVRLSGMGVAPLGRNYFAPPLCVNKLELKKRVARAMEEGAVNLEFAWNGDYGNRGRESRIRVQSARKGGMWIFIERDMPAKA